MNNRRRIRARALFLPVKKVALPGASTRELAQLAAHGKPALIAWITQIGSRRNHHRVRRGSRLHSCIWIAISMQYPGNAAAQLICANRLILVGNIALFQLFQEWRKLGRVLAPPGKRDDAHFIARNAPLNTAARRMMERAKIPAPLAIAMPQRIGPVRRNLSERRRTGEYAAHLRF